MNNILEMKKHKAMTPVESEKEMKGYSDFLKRFWLIAGILIFIIGAIVWIPEVFAGGEMLPPDGTIKQIRIPPRI